MGREDSHSDSTVPGAYSPQPNPQPAEPIRGRASVPQPGSAHPGQAQPAPVPPLPPPLASPAATPPPVAPPSPRRRPWMWPLVAVLSVLALVIAGLVVVRSGGWWGSGADRATLTFAHPEPSPSPVLDGVAEDAPMPDPAAIRTVLDKVITESVVSGARVSVRDLATGQPLYERDPNVPTVPASTTKLLTAAAVLATRGPAYRIPTRVVAGAQPGEVVLVGGGDPTLAVDDSGTYPGAARLDTLAEQVKQALGGVSPTRVVVDSSLFSGPVYGPGWDSDVPTGGFVGPITALMTDGGRIDPTKARAAERYAQPDLAAGRAFARLLGVAPNAVSRGSAPAPAAEAAPSSAAPSPEGASLAPGTELGRVESPPMVRLVEIMLSESDNVVAEALGRQVALARNQPASFDGAAAAMTAVLAELGVPVDTIHLADASGLSRRNRIAPSVLTSLLVRAADGSRPELGALFSGLPVAAWSGTLADRFRQAAAGVGVVRAKTGTLSGVNALSGVVATADGRLLAFAALAEDVSAGPDPAQRALDRIAATLAACGCR